MKKIDINQVSFETQLAMKEFRRALLVSLGKCKDQFVQEGLLKELSDIDQQLGRQTPDLSLLGKGVSKWEQTKEVTKRGRCTTLRSVRILPNEK